MRRYSVHLPEDLAEDVRALAGRRSFSAYITAAVEAALERERLAELADDHVRRNGETPETAPARAAGETGEAERR